VVGELHQIRPLEQAKGDPNERGQIVAVAARRKAAENVMNDVVHVRRRTVASQLE